MRLITISNEFLKYQQFTDKIENNSKRHHGTFMFRLFLKSDFELKKTNLKLFGRFYIKYCVCSFKTMVMLNMCMILEILVIFPEILFVSQS